MAQNRIYIRCKCKKDEGVFLGKLVDENWFTDNYQHKNTLIDRLNNYYDKHHDCLHEYYDNQFYTDYEFNDEEKYIEQMTQKEVK